MECRMFEVTLVSAQNLENVRRFFTNRVRVYAKVSLGDNLRTAKRTPEDKEGQTNPVWDFKATYTIDKNAVKSQDTKLLIQLHCIRTMQDTDIGELSVSLKELFDHFSTLPKGEDTGKVNYPVKRGDADSQGEVSLSYKFGDVFVFEPPSIDWGKLLWKGTKFLTKFIFKGGVLCIRLTLLANGNVFDFPIDSVADIAHTSYDFLSQIFSIGGDWMADIPWGEADFPTDISYPGSEDATSNLQTNVDEERNIPSDSSVDVPADSLDVLAESSMRPDILYMPWVETDLLVDVSCPEADIPVAKDAASSLQTNVAEGSNTPANSTHAPIDSIDVFAESNVMLDVLYMPLGEVDFPVDNSCPGLDIPLAEDATSSFQTNVYEGSNVPDDSANTCVHTAMDATSVLQIDAFGGSNLQADGTNLYAESNYVSTDSTSAATNLLIDVPRRDARDDVTSPDGETNNTDDVSGLEANVEEDTIANGETMEDISCLGVIGANDAYDGETNKTNNVLVLEGNVEEGAITNGETMEDISCLGGEDDASRGETNKTDDVSGLEGDVEEGAIANGDKTMEYIPCSDEDIGADNAFDGETNKSDDVSSLEGNVEEGANANGDQTMEYIPCSKGDIRADDAFDGETNKTDDVSGLEGDVEEDAIANGETMEEEEVEVDGTFNGEINATNYILGLMNSVRDLINYLRAKLHLIIILFLFLFMLPILFSFFLMYLWFNN